MSPKDEDFIRFYRDAVIAGHNEPAAETMRHFNLSRDYIVRRHRPRCALASPVSVGYVRVTEFCLAGSNAPSSLNFSSRRPSARSRPVASNGRSGRLECITSRRASILRPLAG
jgi:hypothetical protein